MGLRCRKIEALNTRQSFVYLKTFIGCITIYALFILMTKYYPAAFCCFYKTVKPFKHIIKLISLIKAEKPDMPCIENIGGLKTVFEFVKV